MKSENILKVAQVFKSVLPMAKRPDHLNMMCTNVNLFGYECGTVHCHAGWFAVGAELHLSSNRITFKQGSKAMAIMLGFDECSSLPDWAEKNPDIWGNEDGDGMFCVAAAFFHPARRPSGALNLRHIYDHWMEVYERVKAIEDAELRPARIDITSDLAVLPVEERLDEVLKQVEEICKP